ncbi:hypothetical protein AVEN_2486-1 [Araneus ventricosus]|uniref:Uncharacterized protein n=1 Tax=Araneus ventricosus TaxID=182803 RepID=A0A4Y2TGX3_ARAVE|nr:hypothetical protein AVEN_2485-1 [Araneus ventricosus]GBN99882.1 hypothetical protein AVEN_2486-1 [Araneus ventricosus]
MSSPSSFRPSLVVCPNFLLWPDLVGSAFSTSSFLHALRIRILSLLSVTNVKTKDVAMFVLRQKREFYIGSTRGQADESRSWCKLGEHCGDLATNSTTWVTKCSF